MLRITRVNNNSQSATFKIEGRIVSDGVLLIKDVCLTALREGKNVLLDFSEVIFINNSEIDPLTKLLSDKIQIINCPAIMMDMLTEYCGKEVQP